MLHMAPCLLDGPHCVTSPNKPEDYGPDHACTVDFNDNEKAGKVIDAESCYVGYYPDSFELGGQTPSGQDLSLATRSTAFGRTCW